MFATKKNIIITLGIAIAAAFCAGCNTTANIAGILTSERDSEKVTPAEFKLGKTEGKIAVFVTQPGWVQTPMDLRIILTNSLNLSLAEKAGIKEERLIPYADVLKCRMELAEDKRDEPNAIASKLNAQYVLAVQIMDFDLSTFAEENLLNGMLATKTCLLGAGGSKIWPQDETGRAATVTIEDEKGTVKSAIGQLAAATAHCVTRYFYDCKTIRFRAPEEQKELDYYKW